MTTLITKKCIQHDPMVEAISTIATSFDDCEQFTFCTICEQNIDRFSFYDDDRGVVYTKWSVTK